MKKIGYLWILAATLGWSSCSENTDDLKRDTAQLLDRVTALEEQTKGLNSNLEALQKLAQEQISISELSYDAQQAIYTLKLSNGETLRLAERAEKKELALQIGIDADGFWQVSYDGEQFEQILVAGKPVQARGEDGQTPRFRINAQSYWEVSTDAGKSYTAVLNEAGEPVKAVPEAAEDQFFQKVEATDQALAITLKDGQKLEVPIVKEFFCYFDSAIQGRQELEAGQTATFVVHIKGAEQVLVNAPEGWKAVLSPANAQDEAELTLTAPALQTRAVANNAEDVSILAFKGVFAHLAQLQVGLKAPSVKEPTPAPTQFIQPLQANTPLLLLLNTDPASEAGQQAPADFWFMRYNKKEANSIAENGSIELLEEKLDGVAITAAQISSKINNSFFKIALGYYKQEAKCDRNKRYKLSFKLKGAPNTKFQTTLRTADGNASVAVYNSDGEPTTTLTTYTLSEAYSAEEWQEVEVIYDMRYKGPKVASISADKNPLAETREADIQALDFRFYPQAEDTSFKIADIQFEEYEP